MKYLVLATFMSLFFQVEAQKKLETSGNPLFEGWYADPEATIIKNEYWIYPTYSDKYAKQVFFDAFSSPQGKEYYSKST